MGKYTTARTIGIPTVEAVKSADKTVTIPLMFIMGIDTEPLQCMTIQARAYK